MLDLKILQLVLIVMASTLTCYLLIRLILWIFDYLNTKFLYINSTGLTNLNSLTMDKTNIYLQFSDFTTGDCTNLYLGIIFGNPEDIYVCGQFVSGRITLNKKFPYDFIILKWDTIVLSLIDLDLPIYITSTDATTKTYHCNWQNNIKCQSHCIYTSTCPYRCCPEMCRYCSRRNSNTQRSKIDLYARSSEKNTN